MKTYRWILALVAVAVMALPASADQVDLTGYTCTTSNSSSCSTFASSVTVTIFSNTTVNGVTASSTQIGFLFTFTAGFGAIDTLAFADPNNLIVGPPMVTNFTGTNFSGPGCSPGGGVPPGASGGFTFEDLLCADRTGGGSNRLDSGEYVAVVFTLASGVTYQDVLNAIANGTFAIGHHVQSLPDSSGGTNESDTIICSTGCTPVPEPGTLALFGTGLLGLAGIVRRRLLS